MIHLDNLTKIFETHKETTIAVDHVSFEVPSGEICILLGPSGCGKTTTLKMINRIISASSGRIFIDGKDTSDFDTITLRRQIGYVIQQIGLFPNMTVEQNICLVPKLLGWDKNKAKKRAAELMSMINLDPAIFLKRYPKELSGGQQQRIGVARALAADPPLLLMDEPFGAIDPINREVIQDEFLKMQRQLKKTILFVSHDIDEAVKMGDKIAIFNAGKLIQYDAPDNILAHPLNQFIADFVGGDRTLKRLRLIRVHEVMHTNPPKVNPNDTLNQARLLLEKNQHSSIVMVDDNNYPLGIIDYKTTDLPKGLCNEHFARIPAMVKTNDDLRTAVSLMFAHDLSWLPVVDEFGVYQGFLTQQSITHSLGKTYRNQSLTNKKGEFRG